MSQPDIGCEYVKMLKFCFVFNIQHTLKIIKYLLQSEWSSRCSPNLALCNIYIRFMSDTICILFFFYYIFIHCYIRIIYFLLKFYKIFYIISMLLKNKYEQYVFNFSCFSLFFILFYFYFVLYFYLTFLFYFNFTFTSILYCL